MRILAIETATAACSVALFGEDRLLAHSHRELGRGHAEQLVPMIATLPDKGRADRILASLGPGSFTGVRIGIAAARALGLAWGAEVLGYPTMSLIAAMARAQAGAQTVAVAMNGGHGEFFCQQFGAAGEEEVPLASLVPHAACSILSADLVAGSQASQLVALRGHGTALPILPDARQTLLLDQTCFTYDLRPIYGRPPDAKPARGGMK